MFTISGGIGNSYITNQVNLNSSNYEQLIIPNILLTNQNEINLSYTYRFQALNIKTLSVLTEEDSNMTTISNSTCPVGSYTNTDCLQQSKIISIKYSNDECPTRSLTFKLNYEMQNISLCPIMNKLPDFIYKINIFCEFIF